MTVLTPPRCDEVAIKNTFYLGLAGATLAAGLGTSAGLASKTSTNSAGVIAGGFEARFARTSTAGTPQLRRLHVEATSRRVVTVRIQRR